MATLFDHGPMPLIRPNPADLIRILVFGGTGVGKTTFVNDASQSRLPVGHELQSCTKDMQPGKIFSVDGRSVQLFDTPGFDDTKLSDTEVLQNIASTLMEMHATDQPFNGFLYLHRITDNRMGGASIRAFNLFEKICGRSAMRHAIIITNMWSVPRDPDEEAREEQLKAEFFNSAIENGVRVARRAGAGPQSALEVIRLLLNYSPVELQIQYELSTLQLPLDETEAGALVDQNLRVRLQRQERERAELEEELRDAYEERDRRAQEQLERFKRDKEEETRILRVQLEMLHSARQRQQPGPNRRPGPTNVAAPTDPGAQGQTGGRSRQGFVWGWRRNQPDARRR